MSDHDLVVRNGLVVDGTGAPPRRADVGVDGDRIVAVERSLSGRGRREIDATDRLVTPGFVDVHTHLDAQVAWDPLASPVCFHGVTSVVMGNCGVTFAPCRPGDRATLAAMMESVEDIPGDAILAGMPWDWVSFGDYLASVGRMPKAINVGGLVGHSALRQYVMGERGFDPSPAAAEDVAAMADLLDEAMRSGALGISTNRTAQHRVPDGRPIPGTLAHPDELLAFADVLRRHGTGVFESAGGMGERDLDDEVGMPQIRAEMQWMGDVSRRSGRPVTFGMHQHEHRPRRYRRLLELAREQNTGGALVRPQTSARSVGMLYSIDTRSPFDAADEWVQLRNVPHRERLELLHDPLGRDRLVDAARRVGSALDLTRTYVLNPLDGERNPRYDLPAERTVAALAASRGLDVETTYVQLLVDTAGTLVCTRPFLNLDTDALQEMLGDPNLLVGLADAGAHVGEVLDAGQPTWFLSHWVRDRQCWSLEEGVRRLTSDGADLFGLRGRGRLTVGSFADLNVIDLDRLSLAVPGFARDLPNGAGRFVQGATGYDCTLVNGVVAMEDGTHTGALAGTLLRPN